MFSYEIENSDKGKIFKIVWENYPMDINVYIQIIKWVNLSRIYSQLEGDTMTSFKKLIDSLNKKYESAVTLDQAISVRNIAVKDKIIKNYARMNQKISSIRAEYDSGVDILSLSFKHDFPPLNLLRGIFINKGYPVDEVYEVFTNKTDPKILFNGRDLKQYLCAEKNDAESILKQKKIADIAAKNEMAIVEFFKSIGCNLQTQDDLTKNQISEFGRAIITPDILFIDDVYINGIKVKWLDYKDYIGTPIEFLYASNAKQSLRYAKKWGRGAVCFHHAYTEGLIIPGSLLLDARSLPIKLG